MDATTSQRGFRYYAAGLMSLLLLAAALFLFDLRGPAFWDYDEGIYAEVMHDTAASSDPLTLREMGNPWFEKPPLYFWAGMALGQVIEFQRAGLPAPCGAHGYCLNLPRL